jgi:hypothetical protein
MEVPCALYLVHMKEINESRNNQKATADADNPGKHIHDQAE